MTERTKTEKPEKRLAHRAALRCSIIPAAVLEILP